MMKLFSNEEVTLLQNSHRRLVDDINFYKCEMEFMKRRIYALEEQTKILNKQQDFLINTLKGKKIVFNLQTMEVEKE